MRGLFGSKWAELLGASAVAVGIVLYARWRIHSELRRQHRKKKLGSVNVGGIFGFDIGGTLTKIVYFERKPPEALSREGEESSLLSPPKLKRSSSIDHLNTPAHIAALAELYRYLGQSKDYVTRDESLSFYSHTLGGMMNFHRFETRNMTDVIERLSGAGVTENIKTIGCTGGGAHKYAAAIAERLEISVLQMDELKCLLRGMLFAMKNVRDECYTYRHFGSGSSGSGEGPPAKLEWVQDVKENIRKVQVPWNNSKGSQFPYLVVNIGSGVSILKVSSGGQFERVSGTSLGGGTYWGLCRLLTRCGTFEEAMDLAETGDSKQIDMLVRDIYGGSYSAMNLAGDMVASSFGKLVMKEDPRETLKQEDIAIALLMMITNNIGQVAYLNAKLHSCSKIFFVGSFLRHNALSCRRLAFAINFWSKSSMEALFLEHDGYFGALGTFLQSAFGPDVDRVIEMSDERSSGGRGRASQQQQQEADEELSSRARPRARSTDSTATPREGVRRQMMEPTTSETRRVAAAAAPISSSGSNGSDALSSGEGALGSSSGEDNVTSLSVMISSSQAAPREDAEDPQGGETRESRARVASVDHIRISART
jgi:type II pantothenate kinase